MSQNELKEIAESFIEGTNYCNNSNLLDAAESYFVHPDGTFINFYTEKDVNPAIAVLWVFLLACNKKQQDEGRMLSDVYVCRCVA
jgi:hypothetical protein